MSASRPRVPAAAAREQDTEQWGQVVDGLDKWPVDLGGRKGREPDGRAKCAE
jgi:hypothetical protein